MRAPKTGTSHRTSRIATLFAVAIAWSALERPAAAQVNGITGNGFQLDRFEPATAGSWFFAVEHPWYSSTRRLAAGITFDYANRPLVLQGLDSMGGFNGKTTEGITSQFVAHVEVAGSFLDRVTLSLSLPVTLAMTGPLSDADPNIGGFGVGDPRVGAMVRIWGQHDTSHFAVSAGVNVWIPVTVESQLLGDHGVRVLPRIVLGGVFDWLRWSANVGFLIRGSDTLPKVFSDAITGNELQLAGAVAWINRDRTLSAGPEVTLNSLVSGDNSPALRNVGLEMLFGVNYVVNNQVMLGLAPGFGGLLLPGTPDFRMLARIAWAPFHAPPSDRDKDGIPDKDDACPDVWGVRSSDPRTNGCPACDANGDRDHDGVLDRDDICPDVPQGDHPDPLRLGCPLEDRDHDGVPDRTDVCPDVPQGDHPDPNRLGCPSDDRDGDGVPDSLDQSPTVPKGDHPDPKRPGCPGVDTDNDGVFDPEDQCPAVPAGPYPDPDRPGCPLPDRDFDTVPDKFDACPDKFGAPSRDPKKNGCPGMLEIRGSKILILATIFFETDKDVILPKSFPLLKAVASALHVSPHIKKVAVDGHTDSRGTEEHNLDLSQRRAQSVVTFLISEGINPNRLEAHGYGTAGATATNKTDKGRSFNRRVEFNIIDPKPLDAPKPRVEPKGNANPSLQPQIYPDNPPPQPKKPAPRAPLRKLKRKKVR